MDAASQSVLTVWQLLRDPILTFYQEGMDRTKLECILAVINNSTRLKKNWYIPFSEGKSFDESQKLLEQYTAFCMWLLGRLFCILGRESLKECHSSCLKAQIEILQTCSENDFMMRFFFSEYLSCLTDLIELHASETFQSGGSYLLKRFTPLPVKALENLNLVPKYILIKSPITVSHLEKYLVEILDSMLPNIIFLYQDLLDKCWFALNKLIQFSNTNLRVATLMTFTKIVSLAKCNNSVALTELCHTLKSVVQTGLKKHSTSIESTVEVDLTSSVVQLVNNLISSGSCSGNLWQMKDLVTILTAVLNHWDVKENKNSDLDLCCGNIAFLLDALPPGSVNPKNFTFLVKRFEMQKVSTRIMSKLILDDVIEIVTSSQGSKPTVQLDKRLDKDLESNNCFQINACVSLPLWTLLHNELLDEISSIQTNFPSEPSRQLFQDILNIVGRTETLLKCAALVDMLYLKSTESMKLKAFFSFFPNELALLVSFFQFLLEKLVLFKTKEATIWFSKAIFRSVFLSVRYIFLLPEFASCEAVELEVAFSIASIPWLESYAVSNLILKPEFTQLISHYPEVKSEELKIICLEAISVIPYHKATSWKLEIFSDIIDKFQDPAHLNLVVEAVKTVPSLLLEDQTLFGVIVSTLQSKNENLLTAVSEALLTIVCILAGNFTCVSSVSNEGLLQRSFICLTCHKDFPKAPIVAKNCLFLFKDIVGDFMSLLTSPLVAVRRIMAGSLGSLVLHLPFIYKPETVNALMKYAEDEDRCVRLIFSRKVKFLIFSRDWMEGKGVESEYLREEHIPLTQVDRMELSHSRPRLERVLEMLWVALLSRLNSKTNDNADIQETLLATIVDIGCVPLDCVLLPVLKIVLTCVSHPMFGHPSLGQVYVKRIAVAHNTNVGNLYLRFQTDLCKVLVNGMGMNFHARPSQTAVMDKVVYSFGFESVAAWLNFSLRCVLPTLMVLVVKYKDNTFLNKVISLLASPPASLIKENFQYIYPYAFLSESDQVVKDCVKIMEELSQRSAQQLIKFSFKTIHNELLLNYHCKKDRVEEGICQLIDASGNVPNTSENIKNPQKQEDIARHLEQRFLGILVHFDFLLESSSAEEKNKIKALQSLPEIIRLMGSKYITPVRFKVLSTLRTALRLTHCDFPHLSCGAWEAFIQSVNIHELGPLLGTITASVLPLVDQFPNEIASILEWLVIQHEHELSDHIPDLFFLPDLPALHGVYGVVQNHLKRKRQILNDSQKLSDYLQQPLRFILHDNVDMRKHGLEYLLMLLKEKQLQFTQSLLQEEVVGDDVAKLLSLLIEGCRDTDEDIQQLCVANLGVWGALDPGHLPHKKPSIGLTQICSVHEDRFAVQALTVLTKAYQAARNTRYLDSFAVAIQELLQCYQISSDPTSLKKKLWDSFPTKIQQVMIPLENSSYYMTSLQSDHVWPHPVFGTRYASTLTNWAHTWTCRIVKFIEDTKAKDMFTVCIPSLRRDINCVLFFLPFILLYAVVSGHDDQHKMMGEEITYIIQQRLLREEEDVDEGSSAEKYQIRLDRSVLVSKDEDSDSATHVLCAKTVFNLLDFMEKWINLSKKKTERAQNISNNLSSANVQNVQKFLNQFSKMDLAYGNYGVNEYARSLMYLEDHLMEHKQLIKDEDHLRFLERIYAQLNEPDGIKGVLAIQCTQPKLLEAVVYHEAAGQHQEALACFELLSKEHSNDAIGVRIQQGIIRCCLSLDQPYAALQIAEGSIKKIPECRSAFLEAQAECFWRINSFENLETVLEDPNLEGSTAWGVNIGRCLVDIRHSDYVSLQHHLRTTRSFLGKALSTASLENGSYLQGYPHIIKLHMLQEIEEASTVIALIQSLDTPCLEALHNLVKLWEHRLELVQATADVQEPLLRLRRCLLQLASSFVKKDNHSVLGLLNQELGTSWLKSAEVARIADCYQQAYIYLLNAEKYKPKRHFIELAKLHWLKKEGDHALATLRRGIDEHFPNIQEFKEIKQEDVLKEDRKICAEAKLLIAAYNDQGLNVDRDVNLSNYKEATDVYGHWEKSYAHLAEYYDRISLNEEMKCSSGQYQVYAVISYTRSLRFGCSLIYHSMSRILTIWLDYGKRYHSALTSKEPLLPKEMAEQRSNLDKMNKYITGHLDMLPTYMFMTGFSQLVSRICHPVAEVSGVIKAIIVKLLLHYPQQTLWMLIAVYRSTFALRKIRCQGVLEDPYVKRSQPLTHLIADFLKLGNLLSELCQAPVRKDIDKTSVSALSKNLPKLFTNASFSKIMMPLQTFRTLLLPQKEFRSLTCHSPFPVDVPYIAGIQEEVSILTSLQRPRKITFRGSDGLQYVMMCKDKDDLRLDARVMEFNSIVNKFLQKVPAARSRGLNIRTYSVVPLNEDCGLIEWVPNLDTFRAIVTRLHKEMGCFATSREIKKYMLDKDSKLQEKRDVFLKKLVPMHPPVFQNWFRNNFTDSRSWFEARKSYVRTTAVMSMVGYILGLGDRHGENILLDTTCGDVVHVDFNCLFNKGERFDCPERVPFRLTHNMVSAMGPTGVEGTFRIACEVTLKSLRDDKQTLLSVLRPFVYDPKVEEQHSLLRRAAGAKRAAQEEVTNSSAVENNNNIEQRLSGALKSGQRKSSLQLSIEGQTSVLIQEATSVDNLCQMYIGWGAYI